MMRPWCRWEGGEGLGLRDFASVLEYFGRVPLPPYMHRPDDHADKVRRHSHLYTHVYIYTHTKRIFVHIHR